MSEEAEPPGQIIVGVSQTSHSPVALAWAADEAARRGAGLLAVRAWRPSRPPYAAGGRPPTITRDVAQERADAEQALRDDVDRALGAQHSARCEIREGSALTVLTELSAGTQLLVVDAPRRTDFKTTPMLAHRLVYQASCPVVIMPPRVSELPETPLVRTGRKITGSGRPAASGGERSEQDSGPSGR
jgi:nucleotide-binding universal stress UspA family protein